MTFEDGASLVVKTVIWATGFRLDHSWIDAPIFGTGGAVLRIETLAGRRPADTTAPLAA